MNFTLFKFILIIFFLFPSISKSTTLLVDTSKIYEKGELKSSFSIRPSSYSVQYAGGIGLLSIGAGWEYGKNNRWETDFFIGYVPKYETDRPKITLTIKQGFTPWSIRLNKSFSYQPLRSGLYLSTTVGKQFWFSAPEKYPKDYYFFSTKLRANIYLGQSITLKNKSRIFKTVDFYYDIHTSDLMLFSKIQNKTLSNLDYLGLSLGIKTRI